jgi:hypothetical protein
MASTPVILSTVVDSLATIFEDEIASQFNRSVVLSQLLPFKAGSQKQLAWVPEFSDSSKNYAGAVAEGADVSNYSDDVLKPATLPWTNYSEQFSISGLALAAAAATRNPMEIADLFAEKLDRAVTRLCRKLNVDWYSGDASASPAQIAGLLDADGALQAASTYAGLSGATYSEWNANVNSHGGVLRDLSIQLMRDLRVSIFNASGERPDLIICDATQQERYGALLGPARRYVQDVSLRGMSVKLDGGYQSLDFDGIPVIADPNCPAGSMLFLNTKHVAIRQLPPAMMPMGLSSATIRLHGTAEEQLGQTGTAMVARINLLAVTGDAYKFQLILYPQLQVRRPNTCGVLSDLSL